MDYDALEKLVKLRDSGALTPEEFVRQKAILIAAKPDVSHDDRDHSAPSKRSRKGFWTTAAAAVLVMGIGTGVYLNREQLSSLGVNVGPEELLCQTSIKSSLINPETAQFFEFEAVERGEYLSDFETKVRERAEETVSSAGLGEGLTGFYAEAMETQKKITIMNIVNDAMRDARQRLDDVSTHPYKYRIKADGKLGNTITSTNICLVNQKSCECM